MAFGNDGFIYISIGDGGYTMDNHSGNTRTLNGKVLRITDKGDVPIDNPFVLPFGIRCNGTGVPPLGSPNGTVCSEIYAMGLRNPYRLGVDPNTRDKTRIYIGDVGAKTWEEINECGTDTPGANFGWEIREGPCRRDSDSSCQFQTRFKDPIYWYAHRRFTSGGAITGGAFVPKGIWPPIYDNTYLFADFTFGQIYHLQLGGSECRTCHPPTSKYKNETFHAASNVADMFFGPSKEGQALYFISVSDLSVRRIRYLGTSNLGPIARAKAFPETILLGDSVYFDGTDSSEPAGNALRFLWVFGDGVNSIEPNPVHAYNHTGLFLVELTVTSATGLFDRAFKQIVVGLPPNLKILSPPEGTTFAVGDFLRLFGEVWYVNGNGVKVLLPTWQWEIRLYHSDHWHPFKEPTPGNNITLGPMPSPEDFVAATNSFVRVILRGTDMDGLPAMMVRDIMPRLSYMHLISDPSGMEISVDGSVLVTPALVASWENHDLVVEIEDQDGYNFRTWSNGKDREQVIRMPSSLNGAIKLIAFFDATTDAPTTLPPSSSPTLFPTSPISPPSFTNPSNFPTMLFPSPTTLNTSKVPLKRPIRRDCGPSKPCARCEGHCRYDTDCSAGLICFYKDFGVKGKDSVPGCTGYDLSFTDWCIVGERGMNESISLVRPLKTYCNREQPCGRCEGHCRDDRGCKSGLVCFKKDSGVVGVDSVPGCIGVDLSKSDWCTTPQAIQQLSAFP